MDEGIALRWRTLLYVLQAESEIQCGNVDGVWMQKYPWFRRSRELTHLLSLNENERRDLPTDWSAGAAWLTTHHHACSHSNAPSTVRVGDDITIADAEERYGYQPHCVEQVGVLLVVISDERTDGGKDGWVEVGRGGGEGERVEMRWWELDEFLRLRGAHGRGGRLLSMNYGTRGVDPVWLVGWWATFFWVVLSGNLPRKMEGNNSHWAGHTPLENAHHRNGFQTNNIQRTSITAWTLSYSE